MAAAKVLIVVVFCLLCIAGCDGPSCQCGQVPVDKHRIEVLFTDDDRFTVKRFVDHGRDYYYVTPSGRVEASRTIHNGKVTRTETESISTVERE